MIKAIRRRRPEWSSFFFLSVVFVYAVLLAAPTTAFSSLSDLVPSGVPRTKHSFGQQKTPPWALGSSSNDEPILSSASTNVAMSETSRLSHVQLKIASVDEAVVYWTSKGGRVIRSRSNGMTNGEEELLTAFVELGYVGSGRKKDTEGEDGENKDDDDDNQPPFALELIKTQAAQGKDSNDDEHPHGLSYLGLSMLLKFQNKNPLLEMMKGNNDSGSDGTSSNDNKEENSGTSSDLPVKYVASAPGDGFAQLALRSNNLLSETCDFYTTVLGMDQKAQDQRLLCLRYDQDSSSSIETGNSKKNANPSGVATTLVFENSRGGGENADDSKGPRPRKTADSFDHLAIRTTCSVEDLYQNILKGNVNNSDDTKPVAVFMKPTPMFGSTVLGLIDPNGYKVVIAEE